MADIRQAGGALDDFQRADENPLSHGGDWVQVATTLWGTMELVTGHATHDDPLQFGFAAWSPLALDGDDAECWAYATGGNASGTGWRVGLMSGVGGAAGSVNGYYFGFNIGTGGGSTNLRKFTASSGTDIDTDASSPTTGNPGLLLIRRNGSSVEGWANTTAGDPTAWTMYVSAVDTSYTTGLHPVIGVSDNSSNQLTRFSYFGGGVVIPTRQQFFRLVHN